MSSWLESGPRAAATTIVFAHGAGSPMDAPFMETFAAGWAAAGARVVRFEFPYMARQREGGRRSAPDPGKVLERCFLDTIAALVAHGGDQGRLVLAGKSMGGRIATRVAERAQASLVIALGYPFHPPGRPSQLRTAHLTELRVPCLIVQGTRDAFGSQSEVATYNLSPAIEVAWIEGGDHSFVPLKRSGRSEDECLAEALSLTTLRLAPRR